MYWICESHATLLPKNVWNRLWIINIAAEKAFTQPFFKIFNYLFITITQFYLNIFSQGNNGFPHKCKWPTFFSGDIHVRFWKRSLLTFPYAHQESGSSEVTNIMKWFDRFGHAHVRFIDDYSVSSKGRPFSFVWKTIVATRQWKLRYCNTKIIENF